MVVPAITAVAAWLSLITAVKSAWELWQKVEKTSTEDALDYEAPRVDKLLSETYRKGYISRRDHDRLYLHILAAERDKDRRCSGTQLCNPLLNIF